METDGADVISSKYMIFTSVFAVMIMIIKAGLLGSHARILATVHNCPCWKRNIL